MLGESSSAELRSRKAERARFFFLELIGGNVHGSKHEINDGMIK